MVDLKDFYGSGFHEIIRYPCLLPVMGNPVVLLFSPADCFLQSYPLGGVKQ